MTTSTTTTTTSTTERKLLDLEQQYWQALKDEDIEKASRLTDDPCIVTGAQGVGSINADRFSRMMKNATWRIRDFAITSPQVRMLSDDIGIVAYEVQEELTVEGRPLSLRAVDASTWVRRDGEWVCALHTESIVGDPFGRDRKP